MPNNSLKERIEELLTIFFLKRILHEWNPSIPSLKRQEFLDKIVKDTTTAILRAVEETGKPRGAI